jgi:PAS domain S-box-containing protein
MTPLVPLKTMVTKPGPLFQELSDLLLSGLEFVGATTGWIGLQDTVGLCFPVHIDISSDSRLPWQHAQDSVWGFTINDETAVLNDLASGSKWGDLPLRNLLSCPLIQNKQILGHVALANKADNFTTEDSVVLRGLAHHTARLLGRRQTSKPLRVNLFSALQRILDRATEGVLLLEESGVLVYANPAWLDWTGFRAEELLGKTAPFPFWVSQYELVKAVNLAPVAPAGALPFRRSDQSFFWCTVETAEEEWGDDLVTIVFFRQTSALPQRAESVNDGETGETLVPASVAHASGSLDIVPASLDSLPLLLDLDQGIEGWDARWEERTGLSVSDVRDSRCDLVLDWLFPQQQDRNRVADCFHHPHPKGCQLTLEVAASNGSRPMLCTFLPLPATTAAALPRRWVLLVGEVQQCAEPDPTEGTSHKEAAAIIVPERT